MADLDAIDRPQPFPRGIREAATVAPAWRLLRRSTALLRTIGRATLEASSQESTAVEFAARARRTACAILRDHGVDVRGVGRIPLAPCLIVSNHVSYLDPLVIASLIPCVAVAKAETARWPIFGAGLRALGVVFVARGDAARGAIALRACLRVLRGGASILNFPEGTTTDGSGVGPFLRGSFGLARLARVPILPVRIIYDDHRVSWFGGQQFGPHYARLARVATVAAHVHFGDAMVASDSDNAAELAGRARAVIGALGAR
jgi:1-acyl-sn-glycerol-3-phosphate acyltransferase